MTEKKDEGGVAAFAPRLVAARDRLPDAERLLNGRDRGNLAELVATLALAEDPAPLLAALRVVIEAGRVLREVPGLRWKDRQLIAAFAQLELTVPEDPLGGVTPPPDNPHRVRITG